MQEADPIDLAIARHERDEAADMAHYKSAAGVGARAIECAHHGCCEMIAKHVPVELQEMFIDQDYAVRVHGEWHCETHGRQRLNDTKHEDAANSLIAGVLATAQELALARCGATAAGMEDEPVVRRRYWRERNALQERIAQLLLREEILMSRGPEF